MSAEATPARLRAVPAAAEPRARRPAWLVDRPRLIRPLAEAADASLVVVAAPAGFGKTTLIAQWAERDGRPFTRLVAEDAFNDPAVLLDAVAAAGLPRRSALVLDDAHRLHTPAALNALEGVAGHLDPSCVLVLATRTVAPLPLGRRRAEDAVVEVGPHELTMTVPEATLLLRRSGLRLRAEHVEALVARTEGWPAALHLAALALRDQADVAGAIERFGGGDRIVADYLRDEVLAPLSREDRRLLRRTAPLGRLTAPLCDAVMGRRDSGPALRRLARANVLVALGRGDDAFRQRRLLADALRTDLRATEPDVEAEVHRRASAYCERTGDLDGAIGHAIAAGDGVATGRLLWAATPGYASAGRDRDLEGWLRALRPEQIAASAPLALTAATERLMSGDRDGAEHWARAAQRELRGAPAGERRSLAAGAAIVRAGVARDGVGRMGDDAWSAYAIDADDGPWRPLACLLAGTAQHLGGDRPAARLRLEEGARRGGPAAPVAGALCLAQLALLALEDGDRAEATMLSARARVLLARAGLEHSPMAALVFAGAAFAHAQAGDVVQAGRDAAHAQRLLTELPDPAPWYAAEARIALARAALRLSDAATARALLGDAARALRDAPDARVLQAWLDDAWAQADSFAAGAFAGTVMLTTAELRVLRFLPSHLSFREIALRLHVSANTVKTQAHAVYRKLDASSRSEAVGRAREVGLVDG